MVIDFYNRNGGGGGTADYATLAGESNKTKLLEGGSALPQSGNTGDVVAVAPNLSKRGGAKGGETALGIYQYDGSAWNPIGGETPDFTSLSPVDEFPSSAKTGEVVAISSVNRVYDSVVIPSKTLAFEGNDVLTITTEYGTLTVNTYEKGGNIIYFETDDSQSSDIIAESGQSTSLPTNDENHTWEMEYDGDVYIRITENNTPVCVFSQDSLTDNTCFAYLGGNYEQIATLGLYQYDGSAWNPIGGEGGDNTILKAVSGAPATIENGDVFAIHTPSADTQYEVSAWTETGEYTINFDHPVQAIKVHIKTNGHFDFGFNNHDWHDGFGFDIVADGNYGYVFSATGYDSSRWEVSEQSVKFIAPDWMAKTGGKTLYLDIREDNGDYYLYIYTEDVSKIWITDVAQNTIDGQIQEGTVIPAHDAYDKTYQASNDELVELAKVSDLPAENRLLPSEPSEADMPIYASGSWRLTRRGAVVLDGLRDLQDGWQDDGGEYTITRNGYWDVNWKKIEQNKLEAVEELPIESEDGVVYALSSSGYGIVQAQSAHTGQGWFNYNGESVPSGFTQIRVPYNDTAESNLVHFKTDPNGEGDCNIYWHPEDSSNRRWDGLPNDPAQNDGEFSTTDAWGNTMVGTKVGDYIVVTFGAAVVDGGDPNDPMRADNHTEIYTTGSITDYANAVMSKDIARMVKCTQAEYDALVSGGTVDANTFYVIISPNS